MIDAQIHRSETLTTPGITVTLRWQTLPFSTAKLREWGRRAEMAGATELAAEIQQVLAAACSDERSMRISPATVTEAVDPRVPLSSALTALMSPLLEELVRNAMHGGFRG